MLPYHPKLLARPVPRYTSYPTAAEFTPEVGHAEQQRALAGIAPDQAISLYVHIPFCREICWYCGCNTGRANRSQRLATYLDALLTEIGTVSALLEGRGRISRIAFGGGSPNAIAPAEFLTIVDALRAGFAAEAAILSVELDPRSFDADWGRALNTAGVSRASLGVQTFDASVQAAIGRVQPTRQILAAVDVLRANGVGSINFDLMYGLPGQDRDSLADSLETAIAMAPERLAVFGYAHVPHLLPRQRQVNADHLPGQDERFAMAAFSRVRLVEAGYTPIGFDHFAVPGDAMAIAHAAGQLRRNFQGFTDDGADVLIGFGASAISLFPGLLVQNEKNSGRYRMRAQAGHLTGERGIARDADDRRRAAIIEALLCDRAADVAPYLDQSLRAALGPFLDRGLATLEGTTLRITEDGWPYARAIAAAFDRYRAEQPQRFSSAI